MMKCRWWDSNPHGFPNDFESFASAIPPHRLIFNFGTLVPVSEDWRDVQEGCKKSHSDKLSKFNAPSWISCTDMENHEADFEFLSSSSIWCHPVISSDIWFPLCKGKIHASTNNNLKYPRFFDAFFLYSVFSVWTAQMEIGGMFRRDAGQNAPLLRHKTKGKSRIMNQNQAKEYYKKLFVNYPDVLSVEEATTLLGFKSQTAIIRRIHQHRIRCLKVGRSFMIPKEYLIDYLLDS